MPIGFNSVPANARVPFFYAEISSSRGGATEVPFKALLIGQRLAAGTVAQGVPTAVGSAAAAVAAFGRGSQLAHMAAAYRRADPGGELWAVALDDLGGGTAQVTTVTVGAASTAAGTIALYIGGRRVAVAVAAGTAVDAIATAIATAVSNDADLPMTAAAAAGVVTLTARHKGTLGAGIDVRHSYHAGEALPAGVTLQIAETAAPAGDPDIDDALNALTDEQYNLIVTPYTEAASMVKLETELVSRWGPQLQNDGAGIAAYRGDDGTAAQATTYGNGRNSLHASVMDAGKGPSPTYEWAATIAGAISPSASADPARPFQTLALPGILPAAVQDRRTFAERNTLLHDGIATHTVDAGGVVRIERLITTYQTAPGGAVDTAWLDLNTVLTTSYLRRDFRQRISAKYGRHKLADDDTRIGPGQAVITPRIGRAEAIAIFGAWEEAGLVENAKQFERDLVVERNATDRNRLDFLLPTDLINQFRTGAAQIAFAL